ncbi:hypothetical protein PYCCODRAFT_1434824 [Trametes coccinea BRFM310]|uniref:Uncharacterized protein n=1 Tax=Trametes coccinea (strain BRFM310) TaxID=1353009 RepID=A0A1Y2IP94_TRAC3|nr:hypothetical protein PYCCODRAFT_1434824 [Trametes coccinea BRFM310]
MWVRRAKDQSRNSLERLVRYAGKLMEDAIEGARAEALCVGFPIALSAAQRMSRNLGQCATYRKLLSAST